MQLETGLDEVTDSFSDTVLSKEMADDLERLREI